MTDNLIIRAPHDRNFINVNQPHEVAWWTRELGCSEPELRAAVRAVGTSAAAVRAYLKKR